MTPRVAQGLELQTEVLVRRTDACIADQVSHLLPSSCSQVLSSCRARQVLLRGCLMRGQTASRKCPSAPRRTGAGEGVIKGSSLNLSQFVRSEEHTSELQSPYDLVC